MEEWPTLGHAHWKAPNFPSLEKLRQIHEDDSQNTYWFSQATYCNQGWFHLHFVLHSLTGPIVSLLGFQVNSDLTLKIKVSTNNTQCVNLQVQDKDIEVKKVSLQLLKVYVRPFFSFSASTSLCARISLLAPPLEMCSANPMV